MDINDLVKFCNDEYDKGCLTCNKKTSCMLDCEKKCTCCLDDIHFHRNEFRDLYSCERLLDCYVCRYSHKYCSEIIYALECIDFSEYPFFNVLSLGCGAAPDFFAFKQMNFSKKLEYYGVDFNPKWKKYITILSVILMIK